MIAAGGEDDKSFYAIKNIAKKNNHAPLKILTSLGCLVENAAMSTPMPTHSPALTSVAKNFRSQRYKVLGGVCSGLALKRNWSILLTRICAILIFTVTGVGFLLYLLCWMLIPQATPAQETEARRDPLRRSRSNKMLGGVCAGIGNLLGVDIALVRIVFALFFLLGGLGLIPYIYAWMAVPPEENYV